MTQRQITYGVMRLLRGESSSHGFEFRLVAAQFLVSLFLAALSGLFHSGLAALAFLVGGSINALGNLWLAYTLSRVPLGTPPNKILAAFYWGEIGKWMITAIGFLVVFKKFLWFRQWPWCGFLFAAFVISQSLNWIYPALCRKAAQAKQP